MSEEDPRDRGADREAVLRRLLAEAVEPVRPGPGAQARLLARVHARASRPGRERLARRLRWAAAGVATALVVVGVSVVFAGRAGDGSGQSSTAAGRAPAAGASTSPAVPGAAPAGERPSGDFSQPKSATAQAGAGSDAAGSIPGSATAPLTTALGVPDLDADGRPDGLSVYRGTLVAQLSRDGLQSVQLPATGPGARVLAVVMLERAGGGRVPVAFVRLRQQPGDVQDTVVSVVDGRLTVLRRGAGPVLLAVDATHGYACTGVLAIAGHPAGAYIVSGSELVPAPFGAAAAARVGSATGCGS